MAIEFDLTTPPEVELELEAELDIVVAHAPYIGDNGNWFEWDNSLHQFVDSGVANGINVGTEITILGR